MYLHARVHSSWVCQCKISNGKVGHLHQTPQLKKHAYIYYNASRVRKVYAEAINIQLHYFIYHHTFILYQSNIVISI